MSKHQDVDLYLASDGTEQGAPGSVVKRFDEALADLKRFKNVRAWRDARLIYENPYALPQPTKTALALWLMSRRQRSIADRNNRFVREVDLLKILKGEFRIRKTESPARSAKKVLRELEKLPGRSSSYPKVEGVPTYLRTNLWFGTKVGGSFTHTRGIINALVAHYGALDLLSTDTLEGLEASVTQTQLDITHLSGWHYGEGIHLCANAPLFEQARSHLSGKIPLFIYQRATLGDLTGLRLARQLGRPLVVEFNGPEVWVAENWGSGLRYSNEFRTIEETLLREADIVLPVSKSLVTYLEDMGVAAGRIVEVPNATDPEQFSPDVCAAEWRARFDRRGRPVFLLLSSFGPWHGVSVAIKALADAKSRLPKDQSPILVLAGHGAGYEPARSVVAKFGLKDDVIFTSTVSTDQVPGLLNAADYLLSPQTANRDGTPFFGSPTKIFEYMASGKPIIASALDQMAEILSDGYNARLVEPGNVDTLSDAMVEACARPDAFREFGINARQSIIREHSWMHRSEKIAKAVEDILSE